MPIPQARTAWISALVLGAILATTLAVSGCATSQKKLLPTHGTTMADIWESQMNGQASGRKHDAGDHITNLDRARMALRRPLAGGDVTARNAAYTRTAVNEIHSQFARLPNPDLTLYIFPHLAGGAGEHVPVPGYSTVFPLYDRPHYGQPGERVEYQPVDNTADPSEVSR